MEITATIGAYLPDFRQEKFATALQSGDPVKIVEALAFIDAVDMSETWVPFGPATITVNVPDRNTIVQGLAKALVAQRDEILAEARAKATRIDEQIQNLLAISYDDKGE